MTVRNNWQWTQKLHQTYKLEGQFKENSYNENGKCDF